MVEIFFVEVYEINIKKIYLHIFIPIFPCGFKDFYIIYRLRKESVYHFKMIVKKVESIIMYSNFFTYYEQDMAKSKLVVNNYNNVYQGWHE
jgi:hypothetical protein